MFIFNLFSVGSSSLCHSVVFVLLIFSFCKTENFYVSEVWRLRQRGKNKTRSNFNNSVDTGRKLKVHETFRRCLGRLLNVLRTFNLRPVFTGKIMRIYLVFCTKNGVSSIVPLWYDWSKVTYSQVLGSPVLKTLLPQGF